MIRVGRLPSLSLSRAACSFVAAASLFSLATPAYAVVNAISTCTQLANINPAGSASYTLTRDIDCTGVTFAPIGTADVPFKKNFNGNKHVISNITITDNAAPARSGMFGALSGATISNLILSGATITVPSSTSLQIGAIAGSSLNATILNVGVVNTSVSATSCTDCYAGGLIGFAQATSMTGVYMSYGSLNASGSDTMYMGGVTGDLDGGSLSNSYTTGVTITGGATLSRTAGLAGQVTSTGSITNVYAVDSIVGNNNGDSDSTYGGLIGNDIGSCSLTNAFASPTFSNLGGPAMVLAGGVFGFFELNCSISNVYYNRTYSGLKCDSGGTIACNEIADNNAYFYDTENEPLASWPFTTVWQVRDSDFPVLVWAHHTDTPTLSSPASNSFNSRSLHISYTLPETPKASSETLNFDDGNGHTLLLSLTDSTSVDFTLDTTHTVADGTNFTLSTASSLPDGLYTVTLSYQDAEGNYAATSVATNVWVGGANRSYAYVTNYSDATVSVIDLATNLIAKTISVGNDPAAVAVSKTGTGVYVANYLDNSVSIIDRTTQTVVDTIGVGASPAGIAITPDGTEAYVTNSDDRNVSVIDLATNTVTHTIFVDRVPLGIAVSPDGKEVYVVNNDDGDISVISTASHTEVATILDAGFVFPFAVTFSSDGSTAYVTNDEDSTVMVIDTATRTVTGTIDAGVDHLDGIAFRPTVNKLYVTSITHDQVFTDNLATSITGSITGIDGADGIAFLNDGTKAYVVAFDSAEVAVVDATGDAVTQTITVGTHPNAIAIWEPEENESSSSSAASNDGNQSGGGRGSRGGASGGKAAPLRDTVAPMHPAATLTGLQERTCKRVLKWFRGKALDRVNARLEKRLGFECMP